MLPGAGASTQTLSGAGSSSILRGIKVYHEGCGGADHLAFDGAIQATAQGNNMPRGPRGQIGGSQARPSPGGSDSVYLGGSAVGPYSQSTRSELEAIAVAPENIAAANKAFTAGGRPPPEELGVRRRGDVLVFPKNPPGGHSTIMTVLNDGSGLGPHAYREGLTEAQCAAALTAEAKDEASRVISAGPRVLREMHGPRTLQTPGGTSTVSLAWNTPPSSCDAAAANDNNNYTEQSPTPRTTGSAPVSPRRGNNEVGAHSAKFIAPPVRATAPTGSIGGLLGSGGVFEGGGGGGQKRTSQLEQPLGGRGLLNLGVYLEDPDRFRERN